MDPKHQLTSDNNYNPSERANAAVRTAHGTSGAPDRADSGSVSAPSEADQPTAPHSSVPSESAQYGSDKLGSATGAVTRKPVDRNTN